MNTSRLAILSMFSFKRLSLSFNSFHIARRLVNNGRDHLYNTFGKILQQYLYLWGRKLHIIMAKGLGLENPSSTNNIFIQMPLIKLGVKEFMYVIKSLYRTGLQNLKNCKEDPTLEKTSNNQLLRPPK